MLDNVKHKMNNLNELVRPCVLVSKRDRDRERGEGGGGKETEGVYASKTASPLLTN